MRTGKVYLVGAGPGDPGLITVRGLQLLHGAQVIVYDQLVNPVLLEEVPPDGSGALEVDWRPETSYAGRMGRRE